MNKKTRNWILGIVGAAVLVALMIWSGLLDFLNFSVTGKNQDALATVVVLLQNQDYTTALPQLDLILEQEPDNTTVLSIRAGSYMELGQWPDAIADYSHMIELEPKNTHAYLQRAAANQNLGNYAIAVDDYETVIVIEPQTMKAPVSEQADRYYDSNRYLEATRLYRKILEVARLPIPDHEDARLLFRLGIGYFHLGDQDESIIWLWEAYQVALEIDDPLLMAEIIEYVNRNQINIPELHWTATPTLTPTLTLTPSQTPTASNTPTASSTVTPTWTPTYTFTPRPPLPTYTNTPQPPPPPTRTPDACSIATDPCRCDTDRYTCEIDFSTQSEAQQCFDYCKSLGCGDVHDLDGDNDQVACEMLP